MLEIYRLSSRNILKNHSVWWLLMGTEKGYLKISGKALGEAYTWDEPWRTLHVFCTCLFILFFTLYCTCLQVVSLIDYECIKDTVSIFCILVSPKSSRWHSPINIYWKKNKKARKVMKREEDKSGCAWLIGGKMETHTQTEGLKEWK